MVPGLTTVRVPLSMSVSLFSTLPDTGLSSVVVAVSPTDTGASLTARS